MNRRLLLLLALGLVACGPDHVLNGNGTSTDNVLAARVLSVDSIAQNLPEGDTGAYPLLIQIDSDFFNFDSAQSQGRGLGVISQNRRLPFQLREWDRAAHRASLWVRLPKLDSNLHQTLTIQLERDTTISRSDPIATWQGVSDFTRQRTSTLLLADFESGSWETNTPCGCNNWYTGSAPGTVYVDSAKTRIEFAGFGRAGKAFHLAYVGSTAFNGGWALLGTFLGSPLPNKQLPTLHFGGLDSITFWARSSGKGHLRVALEDDRNPAITTNKAWKRIDSVTTSWKRFRVRASDLNEIDLYSRPWLAIKDRVNTFSIFGEEGTDLWIDDIRLHGISPSEIP